MGEQDDLQTTETIPTDTQRAWPVAFATDREALEANTEVVVTRSVSRYEIICDWEGSKYTRHGISDRLRPRKDI